MTQPAGPKTTIAGILTLMAGACGAFGAVMLLGIAAVGAGVLRMAEDVPRFATLLPLAIFLPLGLLAALMAGFAIAGGIAALRGHPRWLALVGAAAAIFCFLPLGIAALVLVVLAENEWA